MNLTATAAFTAFYDGKSYFLVIMDRLKRIRNWFESRGERPGEKVDIIEQVRARAGLNHSERVRGQIRWQITANELAQARLATELEQVFAKRNTRGWWEDVSTDAYRIEFSHDDKLYLESARKEKSIECHRLWLEAVAPGNRPTPAIEQTSLQSQQPIALPGPKEEAAKLIGMDKVEAADVGLFENAFAVVETIGRVLGQQSASVVQPIADAAVLPASAALQPAAPM